MTLKSILIIYLIINAVAFLSMMFDKWFAVKSKWRLSENLLLSYVLVSGGLGILLGMIGFKHKVNKPKFRIIAPLGTLIYLGVFGYLVWTQKIVLN